MAGYLLRSDTTFMETYPQHMGFHIAQNVDRSIRNAMPTLGSRQVALMQLDGDELDAALWGLANYRKGASLDVRHKPYCTCGECAAIRRGDHRFGRDGWTHP